MKLTYQPFVKTCPRCRRRFGNVMIIEATGTIYSDCRRRDRECRAWLSRPSGEIVPDG